MAFQHRMQRNRFEYKYLIDERCAHEVRNFARSYLVHDEYAPPKTKFAYPTHSVYLDGPGLPLYHSTVQGHMNRYKLRVRYYTEKESDPVFCEVKRRVNDIILKDRALVKRDRCLKIIMDGARPQITDLVKPHDLDAWSALKRFCDMRDNIGAVGKVFVSYMREAWVKEEDDNVRLTFDRHLCGGKFDGTFVVKKDVYPPPLLPGSPCVLELKFTDRFPHWFREMARALNLERRNNAKYCQTTYWVPRASSLDHRIDNAALEELIVESF
jgi:hypothetical protein